MLPARSPCAVMAALTFATLMGCLPFCPPPQVDQEEFELPGFGKLVAFTLPDNTVAFPFTPRATPASFLNNGRLLVLNAPSTPTRFTLCDHALLVQDGVLDTGTAITGLAEDVNDASSIALTISDRAGTRAAVWERGTVTLLPFEGYGNRSRAVAINEANTVLGEIQNLQDRCLTEGCPWLVVRWDRLESVWTTTLLFELMDSAGEVSAMNNNGQVIGMVVTVPSPGSAFVRQPFVWADGSMTLLPTLGGEGRGYSSSGGASDISDAGWVAGALDLPAPTGTFNPAVHAVLWRNGEVADLGTFGGRESWAEALNNLGQVVGWAQTPAGDARAFLWQDGVMRDLNELIPADLGITLRNAIDISDLGEILAFTSDDRLVLLRPAD